MAAVVCPRGHSSTATDFCDECGAVLGGASPSAAAGTPAPSASVARCGMCGAAQVRSDRFCENDGFDFSTGGVPDLGSAVAPAAGTWTLTARADRELFDRSEASGVAFPALCPDRTFAMVGEQIRIGRRSASRGISPEIDLTGPPLDPGVSALHALLTRTTDGRWRLTDPGSTNGTTLNGSDELLPVGSGVPVGDGDRIHVGAWTTLTLTLSRAAR